MSIYDKNGRLKVSDTVTDFPVKFISTNSSSALPGLVGKPIFDVTGAVKILNFSAYVTGTLQTILNLTFSSSYTSSVYNAKTDLSTGGPASAATRGFLFNLVQGANPYSSGSGQVENSTVTCTANSGTFLLDSNVSATGALMFHMLYLPLESGSQINPRF